MGSWHKLLKSKYCDFFNITLPWMIILRWQCRRYLHNHGFLPSVWEISVSKFQVHRSYSQIFFLSFLEMHNCLLWTCPLVQKLISINILLHFAGVFDKFLYLAKIWLISRNLNHFEQCKMLMKFSDNQWYNAIAIYFISVQV